MSEVEGAENTESEVLDQVDDTAGETSTEETTDDGAADAGAENEGGEETPETEEGAEGEEGEANAEEKHIPNVKFKAGVYNKETRDLEQKEFEIDKRFHSLMKDPESEKLVRELHEKAFGLESVKERHNETRQELQSVKQENVGYKTGIDGLRKIYNTAIQTDNYHKMDAFFERLKIPQEHILRYAYEKVKLGEMPPEQRNAVMQGLQAERSAEQYAEQNEQTLTHTQSLAYENKQLQLDLVLSKAEVSPLAQAFDDRIGKPGAFKAAVEREGYLAWHQEKVDLPAGEAVKRVISNFALDSNPLLPGIKTPVVNGQAQSGKTAATKERGTKTLPNVHGRGNASPIKNGPRSIDDLKKIYKEKFADN